MERIKEGRVVRRQGVEVERCKSVSTIQRMIGGKWKIEILFYVALKDVRHFGQLRRCIGNISESTLSKQLKELVEAGLIRRISYDTVPPKVEYALSPLGEEFRPVLAQFEAWGLRCIEHLGKDRG